MDSFYSTSSKNNYYKKKKNLEINDKWIHHPIKLVSKCNHVIYNEFYFKYRISVFYKTLKSQMFTYFNVWFK